MEKIGIVDIKILSLGIKNKDRIDEMVLEKSDLKKSGTGRLLDTLASLIERNLIKTNQDKSFQVTSTAKQILWNKEIPLWVKILRILEISSLNLDKITEYLDEDKEKVNIEIQTLRKNQLVMMSALRTEQRLEQTFEILPEGVDELEKIKTDGYRYSSPNLQDAPNAEVFDLLTEITEKIKESSLDEESKNQILEKLFRVQTKLDI